MIILSRIEEPNISPFENRLFQEADEAPRRNVKKITLKVSDGRRTDFTKGAEVLPDEPNEEPETTGEEEPDEELDDGISLDDSEDYDVNEDEVVEDETSEEESDDIAIDAGDDNTDGESEDETSEDDGDGDDIAIDDTDDESGETETDGGESEEGDGDSDSSEETEKDPNEIKEAIQKQNLYKKFENLYNSLENYSQKLDNMVGIDHVTNHQYNQINDQIKKLKDFLYDYMIIRFLTNTYVESMFFYQRAVAAANMCLDLLTQLRKNTTISKGRNKT